jgi:hypothetical protein
MKYERGLISFMTFLSAQMEGYEDDEEIKFNPLYTCYKHIV